MNPLTVSVIIPVRNGGTDFQTCLSSLAKMAPQPNEVIVVIDGSTDDKAAITDEQFAKAVGAKIIKLPISRGPAQARNLGARVAQGDLLFFIDADVAIAPDAISQIQTIFQKQPDIAAAFGSYDDQPAAPNFLSQYRNMLHHYVHQTGNVEAFTFWSGCGVIRREIFMEMQGFDIGYEFPCVEDIELGYRLKQAGHRIQLSKDLQGKHLKRWEAISLIKTDIFYRALPWTELILSQKSATNDLNLDHSSRFSVVLVWLLFGLLVNAWWWQVWVMVGLVMSLLLCLNINLYRFFYQKRGLVFTLRAIPWHWLYYYYGGLSFAAGLCLYHLRKWGWSRFSYRPNDNVQYEKRLKI